MIRTDGGEVGLLHATCIAIAGHGVLIRGAPGCGKSDLALRLIDSPGSGIAPFPVAARLVADDQVRLFRVGETLVARAPERLEGLIEIRGLGIVRVRSQSEARLALVVDLVDWKSIERMPEHIPDVVLLGVRLPLLKLDAFSPSAPARLRAGLTVLASNEGAGEGNSRGPMIRHG